MPGGSLRDISMHPEAKQKVKEDFHLFLSQKGLKPTLQRNLILDAFMDREHPIDMDELYLAVRARHSGIGHATVYRALKLFAKAGVAREILYGDGVTRYQRAGAGRHDYFRCSGCGTVTEFENTPVEQCQVQVAGELGFRIESFKIELKGMCRDCLGGIPA